MAYDGPETPATRRHRAPRVGRVDVDLTVRAATPADQDQVLAVVAAAFGPEKGPRVAELVVALAAAGHVRAGLVAELDGEVVGHVQLNRSWLDSRQELVEVLVLSPLSVAPAHQCLGVGTRLVAAAVAEAERLGAPAVFLEGSPAFYGARGWSPAVPLGFVAPSTRIPGPAFQVVVLPGHRSWMTGALVYCEAFWTHDCVGLRDPQLARLGG